MKSNRNFAIAGLAAFLAVFVTASSEAGSQICQKFIGGKAVDEVIVDLKPATGLSATGQTRSNIYRISKDNNVNKFSFTVRSADPVLSPDVVHDLSEISFQDVIVLSGQQIIANSSTGTGTVCFELLK